MSTTKAKKEAKFKARKTSLSKKTNEELIDIILKKDNTERKNNDKIMNLTKKVDDLNVIIETNAQNQATLENELDETDNLLTECKVELKQKEKEFNSKESHYKEDIDNLRTITNSLKEQLDSNAKDMKRVNIYKYSAIVFAVLLIILIGVIIF